MSRSKARADRIRSEVSLLDVLASYGYNVHSDGGDREQQFSCDLHGDGQDSKPSARVYPETQRWYCFACATSRDAIQTVREKEGLDFHAACDHIEKRYNLPTLAWEEGVRPKTVAEDLEDSFLVPDTTPQDWKARIDTILKSTTREKSLPLDVLLGFWEECDRLGSYMDLNPEGLLEDFLDLKTRILRAINARAS